MGGRLKVLTITGIPVYIHTSWLFIYALITWTLAVGYFPRVLPDLPAATYWVSGLIAALLLFVSVFLHELSHSFVALAHGLRVRGITLHVFGGVSELEDEPPSARAEFLIAVVGPVTSFGIAALLWLGSGMAPTPTVRATISYLVFTNAIIGIFNLIPGFPLDGGRVLRAILWRWKGSLARATETASRVGVGFAFGLMAVGALEILAGGFIGGLWLILIGLFLRAAAGASSTQVALREGLADVPVREVMTREVVSIMPDATVTDLGAQLWAHRVSTVPVVRDGVVEGIATVQQLQRTAPEDHDRTTVRQIMRPADDAVLIRPWDTALHAFEKASANGLGRLAVLEGGRLVGYLSIKDLTHVLALRGVGAPRAHEGPRNVSLPRRAA